MAERKAREPRNQFAKAVVETADEIGHPVEPETREEAERVEPQGHFHTLYEGMCEGGPMNGTPGQSRFPKGFVIIDQPNSRAWVYDYDRSAGVFVSRRRDVHDRVRHLHAAEGANYDVRAFDHDLMRGDMS
jgi:hypothetical protein